MNDRLQEILIDNFKKDFKKQIGRGVKIIVCNKWQSEANFTDKANFWAIVKVVFDATGWTYKGTYPKYSTVRGRPKGDTTEAAFRRAMIDYIASNNGVQMLLIAKETGRDNHTSILSSIASFEARLDTEHTTQKLFGEIMEYIKENYYLYKSSATLKTQVVNESNL